VQINVCLGALAAFSISVVLTGAIRRLALAHGMLDVPNERSSHATPTPRGGGIAIVLGTSVAAIFLASSGVLPMSALLTLLVGGAAIAVVGFFDDRVGLSPRVRFSVHLAAAAIAMYWMGGLPPIQVADHMIRFAWVGYVLGILGIVWTLNLFNFMDGIDGIAASQGTFMTLAGAAIALATGVSGALPALAIVAGVACLGFLIWNWPPAKIFMGDAGSGYVGYVLAVLALQAGHESAVGMLVWLILGGVFFIDATVTLARRVARRERVYQAHRSHAYQWLARRWGSHRRVTLLATAINVLWLLPCAYLAATHPDKAAGITLIALLPIVVGVLAAGAGNPERIPGGIAHGR
jgi:Fuc2NAc and GlcNAc transferase